MLNLGKDSNNLCLHFNPRFDMHGDINTIVCNGKDGEAWGAEQRGSASPFQPGSVVEVGWGLGVGRRAGQAGAELGLVARDLGSTLPPLPSLPSPVSPASVTPPLPTSGPHP